MRKIPLQHIMLFQVFLISIFIGSASLTYITAWQLPEHFLKGLVVLFSVLLFIACLSVLTYRIFLSVVPLREGYIHEGSKAHLANDINVLFYLLFFNSVIRSNLVPVPMTNLLYKLLGADVGKNTYFAGCLLDPALTSIGSDSIVGHNAVIYCHAIEGQDHRLSRSTIGDRVTIGAMAIVMGGAQIGDDAIIASGALVLKDQKVGPGEIWGGVPAKRLGSKRGSTSNSNPSKDLSLEAS